MKNEKCAIKIKRICPECGQTGYGLLIITKTNNDIWICPNCENRVDILSNLSYP